MTTQQDTLATDLQHFMATQDYHRFSMLFRAVLTDGAKYLADKAEAYWLMDVIGSYLPRLAKKGEPFAVAQISKYKKGDGCKFLLHNGNLGTDYEVKYATQNIPLTDFPFDRLGEDTFKLYVEYNVSLQVWVIMLPSEH